MQLIGLTVLRVHIQCKALTFVRIISMAQVYRMFRTSLFQSDWKWTIISSLTQVCMYICVMSSMAMNPVFR